MIFMLHSGLTPAVEHEGETRMKRYFLWLGVGILLGLGLTAAVLFTRPHTFHGSYIQDDYPAPEIALPDGSGGEFRLSEQRGRMVLVFFGYTSCPDVCPTTLSAMKQVSKSLGSDAQRVQVVFITVDPERDTVEKTASYAKTFDPSFLGLSGSPQQLEPVWSGYGVFHQLNKKSPDDMLYSVDHSSQVYLIDPRGNLRETFSFGTPTEQILQDVQYLLRKG
jgi:protein SCO1/2